MGPNTTADIFINIKALPQMAANAVNKIQSFNSIDKYQLLALKNFKLMEKF
jgi:hypothetical protein